MHDEPDDAIDAHDLTEDLTEDLIDDLTDDDAELSEQDENASVLSIRRADGTEVVTVVATGDEWNVHVQPGGAIRNAFIGSRTDSPVWVDTTRRIERDEDGTYVILVD